MRSGGPVYHAVPSDDESVLVQLFKDGVDGVVSGFVKGVGFSAPVEPGAHFFGLVDDGFVGVGGEFFAFGDEGVSRKAFSVFEAEMFDDYVFCGDGGVVGAGDPEGFMAGHLFESNHDVFDGEHGGVSEVEFSGYVGGWEWYGEWLFF